MHSKRMIGSLLLATGLGACGRTADSEAYASHQGRYLGIGVYPAGEMWSRIALPDRAADRAAAATADDEQVIVVVDSRTGEVRQCGNLTGHCIGMNPWAAALGPAQASPVRVREHAADLQRREAEAAQADIAANAASAAAPVRD